MVETNTGLIDVVSMPSHGRNISSCVNAMWTLTLSLTLTL